MSDDTPMAFPGPIDANMDGTPIYTTEPTGMSLRDYFAAKAMQGLLDPIYTDAIGKTHDGDAEKIVPHLSKRAYAIADAMLAARENTNE